jgi:hypothetical protein
MKLSIEARVAAAVATAFVVLTVGAIGQEYGGGQSSGLNRTGPASKSAANTNPSQQGYNGSLIAHTNTEPYEGN